MSISIPAHEALGVVAKEYTIVDGVVMNVRLWPGKDGRTTFRMRTDTNAGEPETVEEFKLRVTREVAQQRVRLPKLQQARLIVWFHAMASCDMSYVRYGAPYRRQSGSKRREASQPAQQCCQTHHSCRLTRPMARRRHLPPP